ncbi:MAG: type VI secretion system contractile sheath large subunit [Planctomyces sp.]|nr:type VI secretion system contractile sheath large subunit [Planctomyces sp.]
MQPDRLSASASLKTEEANFQPEVHWLDKFLPPSEESGSSALAGRAAMASLASVRPADVLQFLFGQLPSNVAELRSMRHRISGLIASIDDVLCNQVNAILHHPAFQKLESSWRGLHYLWEVKRSFSSGRSGSEKNAGIEIRILSVRKAELHKDFENAIEFDQTFLFKKIYEEEFGSPGGTPYGLLISDFEFSNHPNDIDFLSRMSGVAAAAFAPFVASASPSLLGLDDFSVLEQPINLESIFRGERYLKWRNLRRELDTRFLGLTAPRVLIRAPYGDDGSHRFGFRFREQVEGRDRRNFLWGSAAWALGAVVLRSFATAAWFADIRGVQRGVESGGLVTGLPTHPFGTDAKAASDRSSVEVQISEAREAELCEMGFIPLLHCRDTPYSAFYGNGSVNEPEKYSNDELATANARLSAMLQYVLCCSRIAHYLKVKIRDRIGSQASAREIEDELVSWIHGYVTPDDRASPEMKARYPLRDARIEISEIPGRPGEFNMTMFLQPHYQLDQLSSTISFVASRVELGE